MHNIFFGSSRFSVIVLDELLSLGFAPSHIVTTPDKPQGRKMIVTPNIVKTWASEHKIPCISPEKLDSTVVEELRQIGDNSVFIVASYGKIIPSAILEIPAHKTLNIHPSLLPKYRGASPLQSAMLDDTKNTGVTIMRIDEQMDHGPIVAQESVAVDEWPVYEEFESMMAKIGAKLLAKILPDWMDSKITEKEQDHSLATYTKKIKKEDALLDFSAILDGKIADNKTSCAVGEKAYEYFRKIQAYHEWPTAYFMHTHMGKQIRVKITGASFENDALIIKTVVPEGAKEMFWSDFVRGYTRK